MPGTWEEFPRGPDETSVPQVNLKYVMIHLSLIPIPTTVFLLTLVPQQSAEGPLLSIVQV
jgi:hypothetical protein